jgi:hypothetical protein
MFEDWKRAWQQAVENFQRELHDDEPAAGPGQLVAMRRDLAAAHKALDQLRNELQRCREECAEEEKQEATARRRSEMAAAIDDQTTVQIAVQWADRHKQRVLILRQKVEVLTAELAMRNDDLERMQKQVDALQSKLAEAGPRTPRSLFTDQERARTDADFRKLQRERAAEARLEELKKKMK